MNLGRCPVCHARISLDAVVQDESGRALLALLAGLDAALAVPLVSYIGLFRAPTRDLSNDRALKLAQETIGLAAPDQLEPALRETVEAIRAKNGSQLKNHNYLKSVLKNQPAPQASALMPARTQAKPATRTESAISGFLGGNHE